MSSPPKISEGGSRISSSDDAHPLDGARASIPRAPVTQEDRELLKNLSAQDDSKRMHAVFEVSRNPQRYALSGASAQLTDALLTRLLCDPMIEIRGYAASALKGLDPELGSEATGVLVAISEDIKTKREDPVYKRYFEGEFTKRRSTSRLPAAEMSHLTKSVLIEMSNENDAQALAFVKRVLELYPAELNVRTLSRTGEPCRLALSAELVSTDKGLQALAHRIGAKLPEHFAPFLGESDTRVEPVRAEVVADEKVELSEESKPHANGRARAARPPRAPRAARQPKPVEEPGIDSFEEPPRMPVKTEEKKEEHIPEAIVSAENSAMRRLQAGALQTRMEAVAELERIGTPRVIQVLKVCIQRDEDSVTEIRVAAQKAIAMIELRSRENEQIEYLRHPPQPQDELHRQGIARKALDTARQLAERGSSLAQAVLQEIIDCRSCGNDWKRILRAEDFAKLQVESGKRL